MSAVAGVPTLAPARRLGPAQVRFTGRAEGDMGHGGLYATEVAPEVEQRRRAVCEHPWTWLRQVHGREVVRVARPGAGAGAVADAAVTDQAGCALAVLTADCAPVVLAGQSHRGGALAVAHAGWAGLLAGVVEATVAEMEDLGATGIQALIGPCVHPECYEFGEGDLARMEERFGPSVRARTAAGAPALDLPAAVRVALARAGVTAVADAGACTACSPAWFSWRARRDRGRQATVVWR
ncbi:MAG: laccase domain-containing protein [Actinomycetota bacterium]